MGRFVCQCCGHLTLSRQGPGTNEVCGVCGWKADLEQFQHPMLPNRANAFSLFQARNNFEATGVSDESQRSNIRPAPQRTLSPGWFLLVVAGVAMPIAYLVLASGGRLDTLFIGLPAILAALGWL